MTMTAISPAALRYRPKYDMPVRPLNTFKSGFGVASVIWRELGADLSEIGQLLQEHLMPVAFEGCGKRIELIGVYDQNRNEVQLPPTDRVVPVAIRGTVHDVSVIDLDDIREGLTLFVVLDNGQLERFTRFDRTMWQHNLAPYTHWIVLDSLEWLSDKLIMSINKRG